MVLVGRAMPVLITDVFEAQRSPFGRLTEALDQLEPGEVYLARTAGHNARRGARSSRRRLVPGAPPAPSSTDSTATPSESSSRTGRSSAAAASRRTPASGRASSTTASPWRSTAYSSVRATSSLVTSTVWSLSPGRSRTRCSSSHSPRQRRRTWYGRPSKTGCPARTPSPPMACSEFREVTQDG